MIPLLYRRQLVDYETFLMLERSREFLADNFDARLSLHDAAQEACLSPYHYQRMFQRAFGESPHAFLTRVRLERAKDLLRSRDITVSEVCVEVGYESLGSFSNLFQRHTGWSPTEFRRTFQIPKTWALYRIPNCFSMQWNLR